MTSNQSLSDSGFGDVDDSPEGAMSGRAKRSAASNIEAATPKKQPKLANGDAGESDTVSKKKGKGWCWNTL